MAVDAFLKIEGIDGESTDEKHKKWIEIEGFSWSATQPSSAASGTGARTAERVRVSDLSFNKMIDSSSPHLMLACCNGKHFSKVQMEVCEASESKHRYLLVELENVIVSSYAPSGFKGGDKVGEAVGLNFGKIKWEYTPLGQDGKPGTKVGPMGWNLEENVKI
jgi:type VI secretion system secreted protein Hcp